MLVCGADFKSVMPFRLQIGRLWVRFPPWSPPRWSPARTSPESTEYDKLTQSRVCAIMRLSSESGRSTIALADFLTLEIRRQALPSVLANGLLAFR